MNISLHPYEIYSPEVNSGVYSFLVQPFPPPPYTNKERDKYINIIYLSRLDINILFIIYLYPNYLFVFISLIHNLFLISN
jgi:hypothetical protein